MKTDETNMGGDQRAFLETARDLVEGLRSSDAERYKNTFEAFCRNYWKPVYAYVRAAWAKGNEEAKDLTQAFFLWLAEGDALRRFESERGSLRRYLRVLLRSFIGHHEAALGRIKRGGATTVVSLEAGPRELDELIPDPGTLDPEASYERAWRMTVLYQAIRRAHDRSVAEHRRHAFQLFQEYSFTPEGVRPTYKALADRYGLPEGDIKKILGEMRDLLRREIGLELSRLSIDDREIEEEWGALFGG